MNDNKIGIFGPGGTDHEESSVQSIHRPSPGTDLLHEFGTIPTAGNTGHFSGRCPT